MQTFMVILSGMCALILAMGLSRFGYTPMVALMARDLHLSDYMIGVIASSNYAGYLIGAFTASYFRKARVKKIIVGASFAVNFSTLALMALTSNPVLWSVFRFFSGVSTAFIFVIYSSIVMTELNKIAKTQYAGFVYAGVGLGIAMTGLLVPFFDRLTDWRGAWMALGALNFIFAAVSYAILLKTGIADTAKPAAAAKKPAGWVNILITYSLEGFSYVIMSTFLVKIVASIASISHLSMGTWVVVGLAAAPSTMVWSFLAKKTGLNRALLLCYLLQVVALLLPILAPSAVGIITCAILFGGTFMGIVTLSISTANQLMPKDNTKAIGQLTATYAFAQMIGPTIAGKIADLTGGYDIPLSLAACILAVAIMVFIQNEIKSIRKGKGKACRT